MEELQTLDDINDMILGLKIQKIQSYWEKNMKAPMLMTKKFEYYEDGIIPLEQTISIDLKPYLVMKNPFHLLVVGRSGRQKTRMLKNLIKVMHKLGYKILFFEPKEFEMGRADNIGRGVRLAQHEQNETLPVVCYTPAAYRNHVKSVAPSYYDKVKFYSLDMSLLGNREIWMSLGVPDKAAHLISTCIEKGMHDIKQLKKAIRGASFMTGTIKAAIGALENIEADGAFDDKYPPLPLKEEWDKGNLVVICYFGKQGKFMNTDIGLNTQAAKRVGQQEGTKVTKKFLVFDDAFMYAGAEAFRLAQTKICYAVNEMGNCQYNYRTFGIDTAVVIQNLDEASLVSTLIEGREDFLISKTGSSDKLARLIPYDAYQLATNTNPMKGPQLITDKKNWYFQWVYANADGEWFSGFPFDCTVGHG